MLLFCVNYLCPANELVYDRELKRCYLLIPKNGTRSLMHLTEKNPDRFQHFGENDSTDFLAEHAISTLTVFVRDPIKRFLSGLRTQQDVYGFNIDMVIDWWEKHSRNISIFDMHTIPQFSFLSRATRPLGLRFEILDINCMNDFYPNMKKINVSPTNIPLSKFSQHLQDKIVHFFTEDIVLYFQFRDRTVPLEEIVSQIRKEDCFVNEYRKYYNLLTYL